MRNPGWNGSLSKEKAVYLQKMTRFVAESHVVVDAGWKYGLAAQIRTSAHGNRRHCKALHFGETGDVRTDVALSSGWWLPFISDILSLGRPRNGGPRKKRSRWVLLMTMVSPPAIVYKHGARAPSSCN